MNGARPAGASSPRKRLGEIFVENGILSPLSVERVVALSNKKGKRFGSVLEELGLVTPHELAEALALQYNLKVVRDFCHFKYSEELLSTVPAKMAMENFLFPLKMKEKKLAIAISDPTAIQVTAAIAEKHGLTILPYVAARQEVMMAIKLHYLRSAPTTTTDKKCVLVVEDDKAVRESVASSLRRKGYYVVSACDGMEAFREIVSARPDLVITDKEMPKLNGYAVLESVRSFPETAKTPVILITSTATVDEEAAALRRGFFDFISKPIREATLAVKVGRALAMAEEF
ncbi:response regulator [Geomonas sp. RF6]|uniref:response regulator n=1 Tax=Geomonas sp. RF6 TaxID=2897342 RepID=UPI001E64F376|nr:response regulator [Geomonas sp. RF6]UFS71424.1 response regulator [Geomonas sp. RF6]